MWFKNLKIYRLTPDFNADAQSLEQQLAKQGFQPIGSSDMQSLGWVEPRAGMGLVYAQGGQYLLCLRQAKKILPASVINREARDRAGEIQEQQGFKPGRKQMMEIKELITDQLLPQAFHTERDVFIWMDTKNLWFVIDTPSASRADEVLAMLAKAFDPFPVRPLHVEQSPAAAMTGWLADDEAPEVFSIDQDTELASTSESRAKVRYSRQSITPEDACRHIQSGKQCTRLAMTWSDRVSFVLTDSLDLRRIVALDVLKEGQGVDGNEAERFASDFTLMTGELARLIADLVDSLGGERAQ